MYFHSSGSRHEYYAAVKQQQKKKSKESLRNTSSNASGTDSGYNSPTSPPLEPQQMDKINEQDKSDNMSIASSYVTDTTLDSSTYENNNNNNDNTSTTTTSTSKPKKKKNRKKKYLDQPPRQPDFVYSCPRPLAFPFHNDCHFLPVAEADPRDVARISPPKRSHSFESKSSSIRTSNSFDQQRSSYESSSSRASTTSASSSTRLSIHSDAASTKSRSSSLFSSVQQGTVRSLKSLFQLSSSSKNDIASIDNNLSSERLPRLEPKPGTVDSLKKIFNRSSMENISSNNNNENSSVNNHQSSSSLSSSTSSPLSPFSRSILFSKNKDKKNQPQEEENDITTAINTAKNSQTGNRTKNLFFGKRKPTGPIKLHDKSPSSSFSMMTGFWNKRPKNSAIPSLDDLPKPPTTKPGTNISNNNNNSASNLQSYSSKSSSKSSISSGIKKLFTRSETKLPSSLPSNNPTYSSSNNIPSPPPPPSSTTANTINTTAPKPPRKSFFSSFRRSSSPSSPPPPPPKDDPLNKTKNNNVNESEVLSDSSPTTVGRIWKGFKRLITGKKSSRVGVMI